MSYKDPVAYLKKKGWWWSVFWWWWWKEKRKINSAKRTLLVGGLKVRYLVHNTRGTQHTSTAFLVMEVRQASRKKSILKAIFDLVVCGTFVLLHQNIKTSNNSHNTSYRRHPSPED